MLGTWFASLSDPFGVRYWKHREKALSGSKMARLYHKWRCMKAHTRHGAGISFDARIAGKPSFPHNLCGIFVSSGAVIGQHCTIFQQVTIGSVTSKGSKHCGAPVIGDNVIIGVGAKIIGNVRVGDNARIGAGCVVVNDVPANATVVCPQPRVILHDAPRDNAFSGYAEANRAAEAEEHT